MSVVGEGWNRPRGLFSPAPKELIAMVSIIRVRMIGGRRCVIDLGEFALPTVDRISSQLNGHFPRPGHTFWSPFSALPGTPDDHMRGPLPCNADTPDRYHPPFSRISIWPRGS